VNGNAYIASQYVFRAPRGSGNFTQISSDLTNGDHNQIAFIVYEKRLTLRKTEFIHMGEVRRREAIKAMKLLGLNEKNLIFLGYPDFGTFTIFSQYWQTQRSFKSLLTRLSSVPYKENLSFGAPYIGESILSDLKKILLSFKPTKIFVSHPADVNVDHKAFYLFLRIALGDLEKELPRPKIYPYLIHHVGWPLPRRYHPELSLEPPEEFLNTEINWMEFKLGPEQLKKKYQAILCYKSQTESSAFYLLSFARQNELFGDYPEIELEKQVSSKEKTVSFFGFSHMFADSNIIATLEDLNNLIKDRGRVSYAVADNFLLIRIEKPEALKHRFNTQLYLFGYSYKTPFAQMPKIRIITKHNRFRIFDGRKMIKPEGVYLEFNANVSILKVPLQILGEPNFILTSIKTHREVLPFDTMGFRRIYIK
jgi:LmbE family N-acetylglucosaminyl deacetylase